MGLFNIFSRSKAPPAPWDNPALSSKQPPRGKNYAASVGNRLNTGWNTTPTPTDWHIWQALQTLRARSREQYRNNDYARRFVGMCKSNIVGPNGIAMQARITDLNGQMDTLANDAIEAGWREWSRYCDVAGRLTLTEMCNLIIATVAIDGECLVRRFSSGPFGYQIKLIDPELLDLRYNGKLSNGNHVRMGVEMDKQGLPVAYYLIDQSDDLHRSSYYTGKHVRVPADQILHVMRHEMIDQTRGVPWMTTSLVRMKNLHGYEEAAVIAARIGASKMGFFKTADGEGADPMADDETADGEFIQDAEPGTFEVLPEGYDFTAFNPDYPHQQFGDFIKATLRGISSGLGVAYNGLANDLEGVNYSSIRAGVLEEREHWKALQSWMIDAFMRPVFEAWLSAQLSYGTLRVPSKSGVMKPLPASGFDKFRKVSFQARRWAWVDPLKDMAANEKSIELGLKSRSEIIREMGRDPDDVWSEIEREQRAMDAKGVGSSNSGADMVNSVKALMDAYGVGVRAGAITPQKDDEDAMREALGMPAASADAGQAWVDDGGVRRPITLQSGDAFTAAQEQVQATSVDSLDASNGAKPSLFDAQLRKQLREEEDDDGQQ